MAEIASSRYALLAMTQVLRYGFLANRKRMYRIADPALTQRYAWPGDDLTVIPDWVYTDETIYAREVERIFHGPTWNYVALEAEIPNVATSFAPMSGRRRSS